MIEGPGLGHSVTSRGWKGEAVAQAQSPPRPVLGREAPRPPTELRSQAAVVAREALEPGMAPAVSPAHQKGKRAWCGDARRPPGQ